MFRIKVAARVQPLGLIISKLNIVLDFCFTTSNIITYMLHTPPTIIQYYGPPNINEALPLPCQP